MDHEAVVREKVTEKYLLDELDAGTRDQFEEHFFDCAACAVDVRAGTELLAESRIILSETPEQSSERAVLVSPNQRSKGWFAWLRPAFAAPVMSLLLIVVGYQNFVTYPRLQSALRQPQVLPWASVNVGTWGDGGPTVSVSAGKGLLLFLRIPPDGAYARYSVELYNPDGKLDSSLAIPASSQQDQWPIQIPGADRKAGRYTLNVHGITTAGDSKDLGKASFDLQLQQ